MRRGTEGSRLAARRRRRRKMQSWQRLRTLAGLEFGVGGQEPLRGAETGVRKTEEESEICANRRASTAETQAGLKIIIQNTL